MKSRKKHLNKNKKQKIVKLVIKILMHVLYAITKVLTEQEGTMADCIIFYALKGILSFFAVVLLEYFLW